MPRVGFSVTVQSLLTQNESTCLLLRGGVHDGDAMFIYQQ